MTSPEHESLFYFIFFLFFSLIFDRLLYIILLSDADYCPYKMQERGYSKHLPIRHSMFNMFAESNEIERMPSLAFRQHRNLLPNIWNIMD